MKTRITVLAGAAACALVVVASASAHAHVSPPVALAKQTQLFTLAVPTEKEGATTTSVELSVPPGFAIDSFVPTPGWKRTTAQTGSGDAAEITKVTWTGGHVPTEEDSAFSFLALPQSARTYTFAVRQTYSDGSVVDWSGPESAATPSPTVEAAASLGGGGGGGTSTLAIVALVVGALGLVAGAAALLTRAGGSRPVA